MGEVEQGDICAQPGAEPAPAVTPTAAGGSSTPPPGVGPGAERGVGPEAPKSRSPSNPLAPGPRKLLGRVGVVLTPTVRLPPEHTEWRNEESAGSGD